MRLTRILFRLSDFLSWLLLSIALVAASLYPFVGPASDRMDHQPTVWLRVVLASGFLLLLALTCFGITRRRPLAVLILATLIFIGGASVNWAAGLVFAGLSLLIFGLPLLLAFFEAR